MSLKFEIKDEPIDDNSSNLVECVNDTTETSSNGDGSDGSWKNAKVDTNYNNKLVENMDIVEREKHFKSTNKANQEMPLKFEIKNELTDDKYSIEKDFEEHFIQKPNHCGVTVKCESIVLDNISSRNLTTDEITPLNYTSANKINVEMYSEINIKDELTDDNSLNLTARTGETVETLSNGDDSEIGCEDSKVDISCHTKLREDTYINEKETNIKLAKKNENEMPGKFEIKHEHIDYNTSNQTECDEGVIDPLNMSDDSEICSKNSKINGCIPENNVAECLSKSAEGEKKMSVNDDKNKIATEKKYHCDTCSKSFSNSFTLKMHARIHKIVPLNYFSATKITEELPLKMEIEELNLPECADDAVETLYAGDTNKHTGEKPYRCGDCKMRFSVLSSLNKHKLLHTGEEPYQCDVCYMYFSTSSYLSSHQSTHTGGKQYQCEFCNKSFRHLNDLTVHKRTHTGEKPYQCDVCNKCFSKSNNLNCHKRIHTGEKPYQCDVCNKRFGHLTNLNVHKRIHTGEKPYQCDACNKCFAVLTCLIRHKLTHTGEKPYQCDVCNKYFTKQSNLNYHKRIHTGEKPNQCDVCNKSFNRLTNLNVHKRTHTGEKPYQCAVCNKRFSHLSSLSFHKRSHTDEKS